MRQTSSCSTKTRRRKTRSHLRSSVTKKTPPSPTAKWRRSRKRSRSSTRKIRRSRQSSLRSTASFDLNGSERGQLAALAGIRTRQDSTTDDDEQDKHDREQPASDHEQPAHVRSDIGELLLTSQLGNAGSSRGHGPAGASGRGDADSVTEDSAPRVVTAGRVRP